MKLVANVVAVVVMVVMVKSVMGQDVTPCNPDPDCTGQGLGDKVEDPQNCTNFYLCLNGGAVASKPSACEEGEMFDPSLTEPACAPMSDPECEPSCPEGKGSGVCNIVCNENSDIVSDPYDCNKYLVCVPGGVAEFTCPPEHPDFNGEDCSNDKAMCCVMACEPTCEAEKTLIPDPYDCTRYYYCDEVGAVNENYHYTCTDGIFDIHYSKCVSGTTCTNLCQGNTGTDTPGETTTPEGPSSECMETYLCKEQGLVAACPDCQPPYFSCDAANEPGVLKRCTGGKVFNIVPEYAFCVDNCPYPNNPFSFH